jgi:hypothetical protein
LAAGEATRDVDVHSGRVVGGGTRRGTRREHARRVRRLLPSRG